MSKEIPKAYDASKVEDQIYKTWESSGYFNPDKLKKAKESFSIAIPPPNATGTLHVGHAVMLAIQDLVIRFQRMLGKKALWLPGTDHAAIATQTVVEKIIAKEGKTRYDLGREKFLKRVGEYVEDSKSTIRNQIRKMGSSCDWSRERFTMDKGLTSAVTEAFVQMYEDKLIYRGDRIVNWCPRCSSTLADDEVNYKTQKGKFYYIKYGPFVVATTRPETKIGDTALAVNPKDDRYKDFVGKEYDINLGKVDIHIKVIADRLVDSEYGSGAVGVTPAHSIVDYEMAQKNNLDIIQVIGPDGKMTDKAGPYAGMTVEECRKKFAEDLTEAGLIDRVEEFENNLSICYRCDHTVEPLISKQWFIDVNKPVDRFSGRSIKEESIRVVKDGSIKIIPDRFNKIYFHWMENLRDWCISRQIWYGHRIPVWYCAECDSKKPIVLREQPKCCPECSCHKLEQDPDTLDTWFSSGLWTFSTLGWPDKTKDLNTFHSTSLMEIAYDILFFWVARMIIMSNYLMKEVPFETVYLHGLVRTKDGVKMSKSKPETNIDPLDVIKEYGADSLRMSLLIGTAAGNDFKIYKEKIAGYRNFVNKLWNISRYVLMTVEEPKLIDKQPKPKSIADEWILQCLSAVSNQVTKSLEEYNFSLAGEALRDFTWNDFADWYLEISKIEKEKDEILLYILQVLLKLWHPFMPFVTEEIWKNLNGELLMIQEWPEVKVKTDKKVEKDFIVIQEIITSLRNLRAEHRIEPVKKIKAVIFAKNRVELIQYHADIIKNLGRLSDIELLEKGKKPVHSASAIISGIEIYLPLEGLIDIDKEQKRLNQEEEKLTKYISVLEKKLGSKGFIDKAPENIVQKEKDKLNEVKEKLDKLKHQIKDLK